MRLVLTDPEAAHDEATAPHRADGSRHATQAASRATFDFHFSSGVDELTPEARALLPFNPPPSLKGEHHGIRRYQTRKQPFPTTSRHAHCPLLSFDRPRHATQVVSRQTTGEARKIMASWELLGEDRMDDGKPFTMSKSWFLSMHEKATLRKDLESWRGRPFSLEEESSFDVSAPLALTAC